MKSRPETSFISAEIRYKYVNFEIRNFYFISVISKSYLLYAFNNLLKPSQLA